jgi:hypothetical protein
MLYLNSKASFIDLPQGDLNTQRINYIYGQNAIDLGKNIG